MLTSLSSLTHQQKYWLGSLTEKPGQLTNRVISRRKQYCRRTHIFQSTIMEVVLLNENHCTRKQEKHQQMKQNLNSTIVMFFYRRRRRRKKEYNKQIKTHRRTNAKQSPGKCKYKNMINKLAVYMYHFPRFNISKHSLSMKQIIQSCISIHIAVQ